jgi:hypothetical protein
MIRREDFVEKAKFAAKSAVLAVPTVAGAGVVGYEGYRLGEHLSSDKTEGLAMIWSRAVEAAPTLGGAAIGAAVGCVIGIWALDADFDSTT